MMTDPPFLLYGFDHSPFDAAIRYALAAFAAPVRRQVVTSWDRTEVLRLTGGAAYQIPVLCRRDQIVYETADESQEVARFVDAECGPGTLFPAASDGLQAILLQHLEGTVEAATFRLVDPPYADSLTDPVARGLFRRHKERRFGLGCLERWRREEKALLAEVAAVLEPFHRQLQRSPFLLGDRPVYADFLLAGIVFNLTYRGWHALPAEVEAVATHAARITAFRFPGDRPGGDGPRG